MDEKMQKMCSAMVEELEQRVRRGIGKAQMLAILTESGTGYYENDAPKDEDAILSALSREPRVLAVACMWRDGGLDLPSMRFRKGLLHLSADNGQAYVLLQGEKGLSARKIAVTMPGG